MRNRSEVGNVKPGRPRRGESTGTQQTETGAAETGPRKVTRCLQLTLPPDLASLSDARRLMEEVGAATGLSAERTFDLEVVVSEACANAIEHAKAGVEVVARLLGDRIVVKITNSGAFQPGLSVCPEGRRRGLGLPLMASLADEVHIARLPGGQTQVSLTFLLDGGVCGAGPGMDEAAELAEVVSQVTSARTFKEAAGGLAEWAQRLTGCDAVILRLVEPAGQAGGWIPALVHRGLSRRFLQDEALIGAEECMCGRVCQGLVDTSLPFFTRGGSFLWGRVQSIGEEFSPEALGHVRGRCIQEGYDSLAIFPLLGAAGPVGSLHLADFGREKFAWHAELLETACRTCGPLLVRHHDREFEEATVAAVESALMPRSVPQVEGLDLEVAFTSATEGARVGGDFYDVIELDSGDALVFVGDYTGNGIEVAGTAARVREAVASLGREDVEPGELLRRVNRVLRDILPAGRLVTLAVCRFSRKGDVTVAVAGHPWPLRLDPEGDADEITLFPNVPLGTTEGATFAARTLRLDPGQILLLFSDGISDSRREGESFGAAGIASVWKEARTRSLGEFPGVLCRESERFHRNGHSCDGRLVLAARLAG